MFIVEDAAALKAAANPNLREILARYSNLSELTTIYVIAEPADTQAALEQQNGRLLADWEVFEVYEIDHDSCGGVFSDKAS